MATASLILRMRAIGAAAAARGIHRIRSALLGTGTASLTAASGLTVFGIALEVVKVRAAILTVQLIIMSAALVVLMPAIIFLIGAGAAFGAVFGAAALIVLGVIQRFKDNASTAGTAASELTDVLFELKHAWNVMISPAASEVMRGVSEALVRLLPTIRSLRGPMTAFGKYFGAALVIAADALAELAPELQELIYSLGPMLPQMATLISPFLGILIDIAMAGVPALQQLIEWLQLLIFWLRPANREIIKWIRFSGIIDGVKKAANTLADAISWLWAVFTDLWTIVKQTWQDMEPFNSFLAVSFLWTLNAVADALDWVSKNMDWMGPILATLAAAFVAAEIVAAIFGATMAIVNLVMDANPIVLVVIAVAALAIGMYELYQNSDWARQAVADLWWFLKQLWYMFEVTPMGIVIQLTWKLTKYLWDLIGGWDGVKTTLGVYYGALYEYVIQPFLILLDLIPQVVDKLGGFKNVIDSILPGGDKGILSGNLPFGLGNGATKQSPIVATPTTASTTAWPSATLPDQTDTSGFPLSFPNSPGGSGPGSGPGSGSDIWIAATFVTPDGEVLSEQTVRAAKKKQSVR